MNSLTNRPLIFSGTGLSGFLGKAIVDEFKSSGLIQKELLNSSGTLFRLNDKILASSLESVDFFVHAAHDFRPETLEKSLEVNLQGSLELFEAVKNAHVKKIVFISSLSAYPEARSVYGITKQRIEDYCLRNGIAVVKPGLVIETNDTQSIFGKLGQIVKKFPVVPVIGDGSQKQYLVHNKEVAQYLIKLATPSEPLPEKKLFLAHQNSFTLLEILKDRQKNFGVKRVYVPVPIFLIRGVLKLLMFLRIKSPFRADSLTGLIYANANLDQESFELGEIKSPTEILKQNSSL